MQDNDLISRAAAIATLTDTNLRRNVDSVCDGDMNRTRRAAQRVIAQLPAVDAAPVVHGRWEFCGDFDMVCSVCGARYDKISLCLAYHTGIGSNKMDGFWYCPHCGALLDGGDDDD